MINLFRVFYCLCSGKRNSSDVYFNNLTHATWKNTKPYIPDVKYGKVIKVYDGDTITIAAKLYEGGPINRFSVRLMGIDAPELKTKDANEKKHAIIARDALNEKIFGRIVRLENVGIEKYGRLLAEVYLQDLNICEWLLRENYAIVYDGGTKTNYNEWNK